MAPEFRHASEQRAGRRFGAERLRTVLEELLRRLHLNPRLVLERLLRLARLDTGVFDEVRDDERELAPALIVAAVSCLLAGFGSWMYWEVRPDTPDGAFVNGFLLGSIFLGAMYAAAALIVYVVMVQFFRVHVELPPLARTMGYAASPLALSAGMLVPVLHPLLALMPVALLLVAMIYAVQAATHAEPVQVVAASLAGFGVMVLVLGVVAYSSSGPGVPIGAGQFGLYGDFP